MVDLAAARLFERDWRCNARAAWRAARDLSVAMAQGTSPLFPTSISCLEEALFLTNTVAKSTMQTFSPRNVLISTTPDLEGHEITQYLEVVSAHVVAGTGLFSDVAASFSDVFGGRSGSYQKQLRQINEEALSELREAAAEAGADAVIGVSFDHDQISGQNNQLLMVTATGTAVRTEKTREEAGENDVATPSALSARAVQVAERKREILERAREGTLSLEGEVWDFLIENQVADLADQVLAIVGRVLKRRPPSRRKKHETILERSREYFGSLPAEEAKQALYGAVRGGPGDLRDYVVGLARRRQLLDLQRVGDLLGADDLGVRKTALALLMKAEKAVYTTEDIERLETLKARIETGFEKIGEVVEVEESGMFSSGETKKAWQLEEGRPIDMDEEYDPKTGMNIYGFRKEEPKPEEVARHLERKIDILRERFGSARK
jgi:uncharacterized protein YbjQ (UPF0145 family)